MALRLWLAVLSSASAWHVPPLAIWEQYLEPYVSECVEFRDDPIIDGYVRMWNLWDFTPSAAVGVIGQLFPTSSYTIPVDRDVDVVITTTPYRKLRIHVQDVTFSDLNKVKKVKSLKLLKDTRYTWRSGIVLEDVRVVIRGNATISGHAADLVADMVFTDLSVDLDAVVGLNNSRVCEVYGVPLLTNTDCLYWTVIYDEPVDEDNFTAVVSGLNVTNLTLTAKDVEGEIRVNSTENGTTADDLWSQTLTAVVFSDKEEVLKELSQNALLLRFAMNRDLYQEVQQAHEKEHCLQNDEAEATEISGVCLSSVSEDSEPERNNFTLLDCLALPAGNGSAEAERAPGARLLGSASPGCSRVDDLYSSAHQGQPLRVTVTAQDGSRAVLPQLFRYSPSAPAATLNCRTGGCELNVAPPQRSDWQWLAPLWLAVFAALVGGVTLWRRKRATALAPLEDLGTSLQIHSA